MANEVTLINGVTKQEVDGNGTYFYFFPTCVFQGFPNATAADGYYKQWLLNGQEVNTAKFSELTDNLGTADILAYLDAIATGGFFF